MSSTFSATATFPVSVTTAGTTKEDKERLVSLYLKPDPTSDDAESRVKTLTEMLSHGPNDAVTDMLMSVYLPNRAYSQALMSEAEASATSCDQRISKLKEEGFFSLIPLLSWAISSYKNSRIAKIEKTKSATKDEAAKDASTFKQYKTAFDNVLDLASVFAKHPAEGDAPAQEIRERGQMLWDVASAYDLAWTEFEKIRSAKGKKCLASTAKGGANGVFVVTEKA